MRQADIDDRRIDPLHDAGADDGRRRQAAMGPGRRRCGGALAPHRPRLGGGPDIVEIIVKNLGVKAQMIDTAWAGIIPALYANKFDCIVSAMTMTKERAEKVLFSMPYADASNIMLLRADEERIKSGDDLS